MRLPRGPANESLLTRSMNGAGLEGKASSGAVHCSSTFLHSVLSEMHCGYAFMHDIVRACFYSFL
jgi:hypothetical protein